MKPKVGYLGGTFDPVHRGHLHMAELATRALGLERVEFLPSGYPPHKHPMELAPALARWTMVEMATLQRPQMRACSLELFSSRPTYTVETLEALERERPDEEPWWVLGSDAFATIERWHRSQELLARFRFVVIARKQSIHGAKGVSVPPQVDQALEEGRLVLVEGPFHPASSTEIRERLRAGRNVPQSWLPRNVLHYIRKYRLYS
jgi:nicotinate-nucleotide adenylyltransferase